MPQFKDLVVVAGTGETSRKAQLAAAGSDDLVTTAWLVHQHMLGEAQRVHSPEIPGVEAGMVWLRWEGTLAGSLRALQLITTSANKVEESTQDTTTRRHAAEYLRNTGNAICVHRNNGLSRENPPVWAIRTEFREHDPRDPLGVKLDLPAATYRTHTGSDGSQLTERGKPTAPTRAPGPGRPRGTNTQERRLCISCPNSYNVDQLIRHMTIQHGFDTMSVLLDFIKHHGPLSSANLAAMLSKMCNGATVSNSHVTEKLQPLVYDSTSSVLVKPGDGSRFAYHWLGEPVTPVTAVEPSNPSSFTVDASSSSTVTPVNLIIPPASPSPASEAPAFPLEDPSAYQITAATPPIAPAVSPVVITSPSVSTPAPVSTPAMPEPPATSTTTSPPDPVPTAHLNGTASSLPASGAPSNLDAVLDALQRARTALDEASEAAAAIAAENQELRGYQVRVQRLIEMADAIKAS